MLKIRTIAKFMLTIGLAVNDTVKEKTLSRCVQILSFVFAIRILCAHSSRDYVECLYLSHEALVMISRYFRIFNTMN